MYRYYFKLKVYWKVYNFYVFGRICYQDGAPMQKKIPPIAREDKILTMATVSSDFYCWLFL